MSTKMKKAPVYFALLQVRFSPVANMAKYVPEIQDLLRKQDYTEFQGQNVTEIALQLQDVAAEPVMTSRPIWTFSNAGKTRSLVLGTDLLTFQTTEYETFEDFVPALITPLRFVHETVQLSGISRVGLRYLDAVQPAPGTHLADYLVPGLLGAEVGGAPRSGYGQWIFDRSVSGMPSQLIIRTYRAPSNLAFPPDLGIPDLTLNARFTERGEMDHAVLDTDHYVEAPLPLDLTLLEAVMTQLHVSINEAFYACVVPEALKAWADGDPS
jgi:uncharacterized protein (TIGR04255 family)